MAGDAYAPKHWPAGVRPLHQHAGARTRCLFGTDWPVIDPERAVEEVEALGLRPESWQAMMRDNAMKLFKLDAGATVSGGAQADRSVMSSNSDELCERFGIEHPIFQAGMGFVSTARLAGAVSAAGGLGVIATGGTMEPDVLREQIAQVREQAGDRPFGVNVLLPTAPRTTRGSPTGSWSGPRSTSACRSGCR